MKQIVINHIFPREIRRFLEQKGIEEDSMSKKDGDLFVEIDDVETAFELRELVLDWAPCQLIPHPFSKKPTLMIHGII
jgi:hypothetical protein